jgi:hypothetical protein
MIIEAITAVLGLPPAIYGAVEGTGKLSARWRDRRRRSKDKLRFVVLRTHLKYIIREANVEVVKLRQIRALEEIRKLEIDKYPRAGRMGNEQARPVQEFYSLPGTASQEEEFFVVNFEEGEELLAHRESSIVFGYLVPEPLAVIHPDEKEEGLTLYGPLGTEQVNVEVHLPPTRRFGPDAEVKVYALSADGHETWLPPDPERNILCIQRAFKNTDVSRETDILRLRVTPSEGMLNLRIRWPWSRVLPITGVPFQSLPTVPQGPVAGA